MKRIIVVSCLLLVVGLIAGCGERTETSRYYYSPSWTSDGKIIFIGATESVRKDVLGGQLGSSYSEYVLTIYPSGTGESSSLFDVTDAPPYHMSCSPTFDYVAYMDDLRASTGLFRKIIIKNIATGQHSDLEIAELVFSPGIKSFDWSSDGTKIVYCTTNEVRIRDWNDYLGTTDTTVEVEANLKFVSWKYGERIAFVSASEGTFLIYPDGSGRVDMGVNLEAAQISSTNTNEVYGIISGNYVKASEGLPIWLITSIKTNFTGELPRLSPGATMVTYSKSGEDSGIYILDISDIDNPVETKIK